MKLDDVQSKQLLPRFADDVEWIQQAFDVIVKHANERAKSIDAPLSMEAIQALTDEELQALYEQYGIAIYYPDLSRDTRKKMLFEMCRIYRYLGTPKAIETLCDYIFDWVELNVKVVDNQAFDENGRLVNPSMLDTFDIEIDPQIPVLDTNAHARLLENIIHFSRNSQGLNGINYDFPENLDLYVALGVSGVNPVCAVDYINDAICEPVPVPPIPPDESPKGYIVVDSTGTVQHSIDLDNLFIHQIQHSVDVVNFFFTANGAAETEDSELESGVDATLYNADGTVADDDLYDGSGTLTYTQANGNMFEAAGSDDLITLQNGQLYLSPDGDRLAMSVQVEKVEPSITAYLTSNKSEIGIARNNSYPLFDDNGNYIMYDSNKSYTLISATRSYAGHENWTDSELAYISIGDRVDGARHFLALIVGNSVPYYNGISSLTYTES